MEDLLIIPQNSRSRHARYAGAHANHAARLRRGLDLHRQVDRRALVGASQEAGLKPQARYIVFHCADIMEGAGAAADDDDEEGNEPEERSASQLPSGNDAAEDQQQTQAVYYYESIDLDDAFHAQTMLAYEMNGAPLLVAHGAPLRLPSTCARLQMAKYVMQSTS